MSAITPDSFIKLVRFDVTKNHQLTFSDGVAQVDFFLNVLQGEVLNASSYQRKDYKVRFNLGIDLIEQYNYMIVRNTPYNYKYFFYYITDMEYINDEMTEITIKLDVFQTYQFDFIYKKCYIEREHVNDDTVGKNIVPEDLETGDYIVNSQTFVTELYTKIFIAQVSKDIDGTIITGTRIGQIFISGGLYALGDYTALQRFVGIYESDENLKIESIKNIYLVPLEYTNLPDLGITTAGDWQYKIPNMSTARILNHSINKPSTIDGYTPKNKKLLTKDYSYLVATNESGASVNLAYENFTTSNCQFRLSCIPTPRRKWKN